VIKVAAAAQRHPTNRSLSDFHRYWAETHGPLYANTKALRRYVQHLTLHETYGNKPEPTFDGISMFWFDEYFPFEAAREDPEARPLLEAVISDDEQLFDRATSWPNHGRRATVWAREHVIVDGETKPDMVKAIFVASKLPGLAHDEFFDHWLDRHGPLGAAVPGLRRYVQNHALLEAYADGHQTHDGWAELWFDDLAALQAAVASPAWGVLGEDGATLFAQPLGVCVARERVQKDLDWRYVDWGVGEASDDELRKRLRRDGYEALADDPDAPARIRAAAERQALAVWTSEHLVTTDDWGMDARPEPGVR
jgi:uncharacterized protein (TIGR02118 family)